MPETDESNYSGRQTALLKQDEQQLGDAHSSHLLINNIHLASKGKCVSSRLDGDVWDGLLHGYLTVVCTTDKLLKTKLVHDLKELKSFICLSTKKIWKICVTSPKWIAKVNELCFLFLLENLVKLQLCFLFLATSKENSGILYIDSSLTLGWQCWSALWSILWAALQFCSIILLLNDFSKSQTSPLAPAAAHSLHSLWAFICQMD